MTTSTAPVSARSIVWARRHRFWNNVAGQFSPITAGNARSNDLRPLHRDRTARAGPVRRVPTRRHRGNRRIPFLPLAIVLATILGKSLLNIIIVIGVTSWPAIARLIRAQTLSVEGRPYLERAKALGGQRSDATALVVPNSQHRIDRSTGVEQVGRQLGEAGIHRVGLRNLNWLTRFGEVRWWDLDGRSKSAA